MIADLIVNGIAEISPLEPHKVKEIQDYLKDKIIFKGSHIAARPGDDDYVGAYPLDIAVNCPHLIKTALTWADLAYWMFGRKEPVLYSVNIFTTYPGGIARKDLHDWHRDMDDCQQLAIFLAVSDIPESAAHCYLEESQRKDGEGVAYYLPRREIFGPAGTMWIENPYGYHYGKEPTEGPRTIAWARFGVSDRPKAYIEDHNYPVPTNLYNELTDRERHICRLLIAPPL